jgi:uncharacterized protein YegP (UPF0339 family)
MKYEVYRDSASQWRWRFISSNGRIIAVSSESYINRTDCESGITIIKGSFNAPVNVV